MLIGLTGAMGRGKDTACQLMQELSQSGESPLYGYDVIRDAFADRLKVSAARALGFKGSTVACVDFCNNLKQEGVSVVVEHKRCPSNHLAEVSGREYLQLYGTEAHRDVFGQDFWISAVLPEPGASDYGREDVSDSDNPLLVITDVRFPNEAKAILDAGGEVWEVDRNLESGDEHISERPLPAHLVTRYINNKGSLDDLAAVIEREFWRSLCGVYDDD